jgi:hypothetical protein
MLLRSRLLRSRLHRPRLFRTYLGSLHRRTSRLNCFGALRRCFPRLRRLARLWGLARLRVYTGLWRGCGRPRGHRPGRRLSSTVVITILITAVVVAVALRIWHIVGACARIGGCSPTHTCYARARKTAGPRRCRDRRPTVIVLRA